LGWFISHPKILTIQDYRLDIPFSGTSCIGSGAPTGDQNLGTNFQTESVPESSVTCI